MVVSSAYDDAVGEMETSSWALRNVGLYHCQWKCWTTDTECGEGLHDKCSTLEKEALSGHDLNRIAPRGFLQVPACRGAIIKELVGLTRVTSQGLPSMTMADGSEYQYRSLRESIP